MFRLRLSLPPGRTVTYRCRYSLQKALVNAWVAAGAELEEVHGPTARPWVFAPLGWSNGNGSRAHTLVVATPDPLLSRYLRRLDPATARAPTTPDGFEIDFSSARLKLDEAPVVPQQRQMNALMLSPLVLSTEADGRKRWCTDFATAPLDAVNRRLSRIAGRTVELQITPDPLYLRSMPRHVVSVELKPQQEGRRAFVLGLVAPLTLTGSDEDLCLAWYAGIGQRTRSGFGCIGLLEQGVRR